MPPMKTKTVWCGLYGGHYDVIIFFSKKPVLSQDIHRFAGVKYYDAYDNKKFIVGSMSLPEFIELYPDCKHLKPTEIDIVEVFKIQLTTMWDGKRMRGIMTDMDGY